MRILSISLLAMGLMTSACDEAGFSPGAGRDSGGASGPQDMSHGEQGLSDTGPVDMAISDGESEQGPRDMGASDVETDPVCGNGIVENDEDCDDGNLLTEACEYGQLNCLVCAADCVEVVGISSYCGDAMINGPERCDDGSDNTAGLCSEDCQPLDCGEDLDYRIMLMRGWRICVAGALERDRPALAGEVLAALDEDLEQIVEVLPFFAIDFLRRVFIWLELSIEAFPGGVYHPSAEWLSDNGYPEAWARGIQLGNAENYMAWVEQQPAMMLHELAHAWHHQRLGYDHQPIIDAYEAAMEAGLYDEVEYISGGIVEAYATGNHVEYFAELTEAWFWINDFYPFDRNQLSDHDPIGAAVLQGAWNEP